MGTRTGNPTWQDTPSTATLITAARLNAIETAIDASAEAAATFVALTRSSDFAVANASNVIVQWNSETEDAGGFHDNVSNTDRITVPSGEAGVYQVTAALCYPATAGAPAGYRSVHVLKNGVLRFDNGVYVPSAAGVVVAQTVLTLRLAAGDYLQIRAYQDSGGSVNLIGSRSAVWVTKLGS